MMNAITNIRRYIRGRFEDIYNVILHITNERSLKIQMPHFEALIGSMEEHFNFKVRLNNDPFNNCVPGHIIDGPMRPYLPYLFDLIGKRFHTSLAQICANINIGSNDKVAPMREAKRIEYEIMIKKLTSH